MSIYRSGKYTTMPRLSLYRPEKGNDYRFIDKTIWEMFQVGGTDVLIHKYLGVDTSNAPGTPSQPKYDETNPFQIQDLLFLENRDRKYDPDVYIMRGVYNLQDTDFNLSQFGLFLQNDTIFITFHINDTIEKIGRKLLSGDVIELPHLKDEFALNDLQFALKRFYVIEEVTRAAEGFSVTWYPHLYRAKCKPLVDSQEFKDILNKAANSDADKGAWETAGIYFPGDVVVGPDGKQYEVLTSPDTINGISGIQPPNSQYYQLADTLKEIISTYNREMQITQAVLNQAEADAPKSGFDTTKLYTVQYDDEGFVELALASADDTLIPSTDTNGNPLQTLDENGVPIVDGNGDPVYQYMSVSASSEFQSAEYNDYQGYLIGDGLPTNGAVFTSGIAFPLNPIKGQYTLRTDYLPNRLFRYDGGRWVKMEDNVRMTMSNLGPSDVAPDAPFAGKDARSTQKATFVNNTNESKINGKMIKEKQSLSKALRPEADE
jgi:hypothetical protein